MTPETIKKFDVVWELLKGNDAFTNMAIWCTLADYIAGQQGMHGYEMAENVLPIMRQVADAFGKCE